MEAEPSPWFGITRASAPILPRLLARIPCPDHIRAPVVTIQSAVPTQPPLEMTKSSLDSGLPAGSPTPCPRRLDWMWWAAVDSNHLPPRHIGPSAVPEAKPTRLEPTAGRALPGR